MRFSTRFCNFASVTFVGLLMLVMYSCKGRTIDNWEPTGDTIEVVIMQQPDTINEILNDNETI